MNKLILNTITAALLPLSMQGVSAQSAGAYSYIGNINRDTVSKFLVDKRAGKGRSNSLTT
jgi:hypothetical protein